MPGPVASCEAMMLPEGLQSFWFPSCSMLNLCKTRMQARKENHVHCEDELVRTDGANAYIPKMRINMCSTGDWGT